MMIPKHTRIEMPKLKRSAKAAPHCFACWRENLGETVLCLAHDNWTGKGVHLKTHDALGAILCCNFGGCHDFVDNRRGGSIPVEERQALFFPAARRTLAWWLENGFLK